VGQCNGPSSTLSGHTEPLASSFRSVERSSSICSHEARDEWRSGVTNDHEMNCAWCCGYSRAGTHVIIVQPGNQASSTAASLRIFRARPLWHYFGRVDLVPGRTRLRASVADPNLNPPVKLAVSSPHAPWNPNQRSCTGEPRPRPLPGPRVACRCPSSLHRLRLAPRRLLFPLLAGR
jgi:hypothetical protein